MRQLVVASIILLGAALDFYGNPESLRITFLGAFCAFIFACCDVCCPNRLPWFLRDIIPVVLIILLFYFFCRYFDVYLKLMQISQSSDNTQDHTPEQPVGDGGFVRSGEKKTRKGLQG